MDITLFACILGRKEGMFVQSKQQYNVLLAIAALDDALFRFCGIRSTFER
jgi:hypothetical protein